MLQIKIAILSAMILIVSGLLFKYGLAEVLIFVTGYGSIVFVVYMVTIAIFDILDNLKGP